VAGFLAAALWWPDAGVALVAVLATYGLLIGVVALRSARRLGARGALALAAVFPTMHVSYGVGYLRGIRNHFLRSSKSPRPAARVALSR